MALSMGAAAAAVAVSLAVIALAGADPMAAGRALLDGAFGSRDGVASTLEKMVPLVLVSLGWLLAFSAGRINIGLEGQILAGGIVATFVAVSLSGLPRFVHLPLAVLCGAVGGGMWAGIAAVLWAWRRVNEIIATLMLNFVAIQLVSWLVRGPLQEPSHTFPRSRALAQSARWPHLLAQSPLTWDIFLATALVVVVAVVLSRTVAGFRLRLIGANEEAARHAGINTVLMTVFALVASGALAGVAGSSLILAGESPAMEDNFSSNYGFDGIVVALLARNAPLACIPAALLFAALRQGGGLMEARVGVSSSLVEITQGLVILLVAGAGMIVQRQRSSRVDTPVLAAGVQPFSPTSSREK